MAGRGVCTEDTKPRTTSPASLNGLNSSSGPPPSWRQGLSLFPRTCNGCRTYYSSCMVLSSSNSFPPGNQRSGGWGIRGAGVGEGFGAERSSLIWLKLHRLHRLLDADASPKRWVSEGLQSSNVGQIGLAAVDSQTKRRRSSTPWLNEPAAILEPTLAILLIPLRMSESSSWVSLKVEKEGFHILRGIPGAGVPDLSHDL
jgi:hypothetical protein